MEEKIVDAPEYVYVVEAEGYKPRVYVRYDSAMRRVTWTKNDQMDSGTLVPRAFCTRVKIEY